MDLEVRPNTRCCAVPSFSVGVFLFLLALDILVPFSAYAGEWRVAPIRLVLERGMRSGVINVQNDGHTPMNFHVQVKEWTQNINGIDEYAETNDLIFFPKQLVIPPKEERVIRVGLKGGAGVREKTYRLFVEEVPPPRTDAATQTNVAIAIRFAVPLFISPSKEVVGGEIVTAGLNKGNLGATLKNTGNVHFRIKSIDLSGMNSRGEAIFTQELSGWYLLSGASRTYSAPIPEDICSQLHAIEIQAQTDRLSFKRKIDADPAMCAAQ